jgi:hypothetical protein
MSNPHNYLARLISFKACYLWGRGTGSREQGAGEQGAGGAGELEKFDKVSGIRRSPSV